MNVSRRTAQGLVNPYEHINTQVIYATSAGMKSSYAYAALIDVFERSIISPDTSFCIGLDYRIPMLHNLIDKNYVKNLKLSPSYNEQTFAAEYLGIWQGGSEESWFNFEKLTRYRKLKNPEWHQKGLQDKDHFYLLSVDVARLKCQTVVCVWKIAVRNNKFYSSLVNVYVIGRESETKTFERQAADLKKIIRLFNPIEVIIDTNGLGVGLGDEMIKSQYDENGEELPPLGFFNDKEYQKIQPKDAPQILYGIKANGPLNSKIHSNAFARLQGGLVRFLITEQEARASLLSTKVGQKMKTEDRIKRIMPHEMTTRLFDEMANLRAKRNGLDIILEQINARFTKDKFSAFEYGLWRIKELEEERFSRQLRRGNGPRKMVFYTGGC